MSTRKKWLLGFAVWTVLGLLAASQSIAFFSYIDRPFSAPLVLGRSLLSWYACAVFTPLIFAVARRFRLDGPRWRSALPVHIAALIAFIPARLALYLPIASALNFLREPVVFTQWIYDEAFPLILTYASIVAAC